MLTVSMSRARRLNKRPWMCRAALLVAALTALAPAAACKPGSSGDGSSTEDLPPASPRTGQATTGRAGRSVLVEADFPVALAPSSDGRVFFAERGGSIKVYRDGTVTTFATVSVSEDGERGLLGLALDPGFPKTPYVYAFYSPREREDLSYVVRWRDENNRGASIERLIELPAGDDCCHKGGRIAFGSDGKLYVSVGENHVPEAAPKTGDLRGKILRYSADGSVPRDNPFGNAVWAYGLRNVFGMAFGPDGALFATDNGPSGDIVDSCCDKAIRVDRGTDYGWPRSWGNKNLPAGLDPPLWTSGNDVVVPTGMAWIDSSKVPELDGKLVFCTFAESQMVVLGLDSDMRKTTSTERGPQGCGLDVATGPDGTVYFSDSSTIYRMGG